MQDLKDKTAVITGGASGIGLAMAHRFGAAGMNLVLGDIETGPLDEAAKTLSAAGYQVESVKVDVRELDQIKALETSARDRFGQVHVLCNNAGVGAGGGVADPDDIELWKWTIDVNLWGVIYGCKVFMPAMIEHGEAAHVVNTASMAGLAAAPFMGPYNISKYGVVALSETLSKEMQMAGTAVGVSVLCPAFVQTQIGESRRNMPPDVTAHMPDPEENSEMAAMMAGLIAGGLPTEVVADAVHDAVVDNNFWILTHDETLPMITGRAEQIVKGINPTLAGFV